MCANAYFPINIFTPRRRGHIRSGLHLGYGIWVMLRTRVRVRFWIWVKVEVRLRSGFADLWPKKERGVLRYMLITVLLDSLYVFKELSSRREHRIISLALSNKAQA